MKAELEDHGKKLLKSHTHLANILITSFFLLAPTGGIIMLSSTIANISIGSSVFFDFLWGDAFSIFYVLLKSVE